MSIPGPFPGGVERRVERNTTKTPMADNAVVEADYATSVAHWQRNRAALAPILDALREPIVVFDMANHCLFANHAFFELVGIPPSGPDVLPQPEIRSRDERSWPDYLRDWTTQSEIDVEIAMVDGVHLPATARIETVLGGGEGSLLILLLRTRPLQDILADVKQLLASATEDTNPAEQSDEDRMATLSRQERKVVEYFMEGKRVSTIAVTMEISEHTVRNYLKRIYKKTRVHSAAELREWLA